MCNNKRIRILSYTLFFLTVFKFSYAQYKAPEYDLNEWGNLTNHEIPEWFKDAKLGIYAHLGVYSVPAYGNEKYPRQMYLVQNGKPSKTMEHHIETYGPLTQFGYKDFAPMFKAEKYDAEAWADLFQKAGAKFAGIVTEHHDNFAMWPSKVNRWNAMEMGPKKDIYGDIVSSLRKRDIKILATFHNAFKYYFPDNKNSILNDPRYADLYGRLDSTLTYHRWYDQLVEVIDSYKPDQIWFDFDLKNVPVDWRLKFANYYYSKEKEWNKPVIIARKFKDFPDGVGVLDVERSVLTKSADTLWQTDDALAVNSWTWVEGLILKPSEEMVHELIDVVSKNGVLLVNVCPKADGTIPEDQQRILLDLGHFLKVNGEAIYATRPYKIHGEGPSLFDRGRGLNKEATEATKFTAEDIRFTRSKDGKKIYIITLGWPENKLIVKSLSEEITKNEIKSVRLLGSNSNVTYTKVNQVLTINTKKLKQVESQYAFAWEVSLK